MANSITVAAPATAPTITTQLLASMAAQSGVLTDYNKGSQIRTLAEAQAMIGEMQGVIANAEAFQAIVYSAMYAFGITPYAATSAVGNVTFATSFSTNPPAVGAPVLIPQGTIVSTVSGIQFVTTQTAILPAGSSSINAPIAAVATGTTGNVGAGTITQLISSLSYPLQVSNPAPTSGGAAQEPITSTLNRFAAAVAAINGATPVAIANACIGVSVASTQETVVFATVYEPWIANNNQTPGYQVYVDNGSGSASQTLLNQVTTTLNGLYPNLPGNRPAGVPFSVNAVVPTYATVTVSGDTTGNSTAAQLTTLTQNALSTYFSAVGFGEEVSLADITAAVANAVGGGVSGLTVGLENSSGAAITTITPPAYGRVILQNLNISFT